MGKDAYSKVQSFEDMEEAQQEVVAEPTVETVETEPTQEGETCDCTECDCKKTPNAE
jgi:hypothetical protein